MDDSNLQKLVEEISNEYFNKPFKHKATFNARLKTTGGRYLLSTHNIEINPKQLDHFGLEVIVGIIKHELCHYHLHIEGKGYMHRDREFQSLLKEVDGLRYCGTVPGQKRNSKTTHEYQCTNCKTLFYRKREVDTKKYACGKCKGRIRKIKTTRE